MFYTLAQVPHHICLVSVRDRKLFLIYKFGTIQQSTSDRVQLSMVPLLRKEVFLP